MFSGCVIVFFVAAASVSDSQLQSTLAHIIEVIIAIVYITSGVLFMVYSSLMARHLASSPDASTFASLMRNMTITGVVVSVCFAAEAAFWLGSVFSSGLATSNSYTVVSIACDVCSLAAMLLLFKSAVDRLHAYARQEITKPAKSEQKSHSESSGTPAAVQVEMVPVVLAAEYNHNHFSGHDEVRD